MIFNNVLDMIISKYDISFYEGGSGYTKEILKHEISPRDYLTYCENIIGKPNIAMNEQIEIISNLKRACDCQMEIFFDLLNISDVIKKRNLGFDSKIAIIYELGMFPKRSILRISEIRNKVEHEFRKPEIGDITAYSDLVWALIIVVEKQIQILMNCMEIDFGIDDETEKNDWYNIKYVPEECKIMTDFHISKNESDFEISINDDYAVFIKALHLFFLLIQNNYRSNDAYTMREIRKLYN